MKHLLPKISSVLILLFCITFSGYSQKRNFKFKVLNSVDGKPLSNASIVLLRDRDSALIAFGITDSLGRYSFTNIKLLLPTSFVVSFLGFLNGKVTVDVNGKNDMDTIMRLVPNAKSLDEVIVRSGTPIQMNKDSLEYNTIFFKTMPNAVVEELFKKLPGFEVRDNGDVFVNGQKVSRILVDGKEFFSSDPLVLLRNLPAELIAKVQVVDEKNTVATETRQQLNIPKIINLKLKKEVRQGLIGKVFGGYGSQNRYEGGGLINMFRDTLQISLMGTSSNQSSNGFSRQDMNNMGGFSRSGQAGGESTNEIGNNSYGMGIPRKSIVGTNINYNFTKDIQLNLQYFYSNNDFLNQTTSREQQFLVDSMIYTNGIYGGHNNNNSQKVNAGFRLKQDSTGYLTASAKLNISNREDFNEGFSTSYSTNTPFLSASNSASQNQEHNTGFSMAVGYQKTFVKHKIDINIDGSFDIKGKKQTAYSNVITRLLTTGLIPDTVIQNKLMDLPEKTASVSIGINKTVSKHSLVGVSTSYNSNKILNGGQVFQYDPISGGEVFVAYLSQILTQNRQNLDNGFFYRYHQNKNDFTLNIGAKLKSLFLTNLYNVGNINTLNRNYYLFSPEISINFKNINFTFNRNLNAPSSYYLSPIVDSSNKLYVSKGNPDLNPATNTNIRLSYNKYWTKQQLFFNASLNSTFSSNVVVNRRVVSTDGKTYSDYLNTDKGKNFDGYLSTSKGFHKNDYSYNLSVSVNGSINYIPLYLNNIISQSYNTYANASVSGSWSWKSVLSFNGGYRLNTNGTHNADTSLKSIQTVSSSFFVQSKWKPTRRLVFQWNNTLNNNPGATPGYPKTWLFSDASVAYSFMKKQQLQFRLSAYDIFNQNTGVYRGVSQNFIYDVQNLVQKRYVMLTVTYSFKKLGK